jgi:prepilin peptidase CpaA
MNPPTLAFFAIGVVTLVAAATDAKTGRIPNWLTLPAALVGLALHAAASGWAGLLASALGALVSISVPWLLHRVSRGVAIGGGDAKLFAAVGALGGPTAGLEIELSAFVVVAVFALVRLAFAGRLLRVLGNAAHLFVRPFVPARFRRPIEPEGLTEMRMGPAIFVAALSVTLLHHLPRPLAWLAGG